MLPSTFETKDGKRAFLTVPVNIFSAKLAELSLEQQKKAIKAQILEKSQGASKIISKYGTINCGMSKASQGKYITQDMVGTYINPRKAFRQFRFNQPKGV